MSDKIKVVYQFPGEISHIAEIPNTLTAFQKLIGGHIEVHRITDSLLLVMDEEGCLKNLPDNVRCVRYGTICGPVVVVAEDMDDFRSLTPEEIQDARAWLLRHSV